MFFSPATGEVGGRNGTDDFLLSQHRRGCGYKRGGACASLSWPVNENMSLLFGQLISRLKQAASPSERESKDNNVSRLPICTGSSFYLSHSGILSASVVSQNVFTCQQLGKTYLF